MANNLIDQSEEYCSKYCEDQGIDCIGSARGPEEEGHEFGGYILIKDTRYWDARIEEGSGILGKLGRLLAELDFQMNVVWRLQAIQEFDDDPIDETERLVIIYRNKSKNSQAYDLEREVYSLPSGEIVQLVKRLLRSPMDKYRIYPPETKDLLICTHTERDRCCSRFGYPIYREIAKLDDLNGYKVWRSSHIGGHRMAPTLIDLPSARYWGYMTPEVTKNLIHDNLVEEDILYHYRGKAGLPEPFQIVERQGLIKFRKEWMSGKVNTKVDEKPGKWIVTCQVGENKITNVVSKDIIVHELGMTKCAVLKPIKEFKLVE